MVTYADPIKAKCGSKVGVNQRFKITFKTDETKAIQKRSGNPGYLEGYPLKIGFQASSAKPVSSY